MNPSSLFSNTPYKSKSSYKISRIPAYKISNKPLFKNSYHVHYMPSFKKSLRLERMNVYLWFAQVILSVAITLT
jgi:hypothetical protein